MINRNSTSEEINSMMKDTVIDHLGIEFTEIGDNRIVATMPVDERTVQPARILHGGATLLLAETVAGLGSQRLCNSGEECRGIQVSGSHISSVREGVVKAIGTLVHKGKSTHIWNIDAFSASGKLVSSVRVTNSILHKR